jgi:hypothetical protein
VTTALPKLGKEQRPKNPYIGPQPFGVGQELPNRQDEAQEVVDLIIAERVLLMHAPSGAGKTSLIQAAVMPRLVKSGFQIAGPVRVDKPLPVGDADSSPPLYNRYIRSVGVYLLGENERAGALALRQFTLEQILDKAFTPARRGQVPLLVIDQLEEILTLDPTDRPAKKLFFREVGHAIANGDLWVLLAMREDFMGGLDPYLRYLPGHLRSRFRLDFLSHSEARQAIQKPALAQGVTISDEAATELVSMLARTEVQGPDQDVESKRTPYVEPFQLQVVCRQLWRDIRKERHSFRTIEVTDVVQYADVKFALSRYYSDSVAEIVTEYRIDEKALRDWFENQLITAQGFRSQTTTGPTDDARNSDILKRLVEMFLIDSDTRGMTVWYELAHDRLIPAVRANNRQWRFDNLDGWQRAALEWHNNGRRKLYLLPPELLVSAPAPDSAGLEEFEVDYLKDSREAWSSSFRLLMYKTAWISVGLIAVVEFAIIIALLFR